MRTIWKYDVEPGIFEINMPANAKIMSVQMQAGKAVMWAFIPNGDMPRILRSFVTYGTGHDVKQAGLIFIGTFQPDGTVPLVFHLFEIRPACGRDELGRLP